MHLTNNGKYEMHLKSGVRLGEKNHGKINKNTPTHRPMSLVVVNAGTHYAV